MKRSVWLACIAALSQCIIAAAGAEEAVINMESTVKGNQEQPKVLYIVPWKAPEGPAMLYQSIDSQLQAVFSHVDRAEFRRQLHYLKQISESNNISESNTGVHK